MEIDINKYLTEDDIREICAEEVKSIIRRNFSEKDLARIISNSAFYKAYDIIDESLPEGYSEGITEKVEEILNNVANYQIFRYHYSTNKPESKAAMLIEEVINARKDDMVAKMNEIIDAKLNGTDDELYAEFQEKLSDALWNGFNIKFERQ